MAKTEVDWSLQPRCCVLKFQLLAANEHLVGALRTCRVTNIMLNAHACAGLVEQPGAGACEGWQYPHHPIRHQTAVVSLRVKTSFYIYFLPFLVLLKGSLILLILHFCILQTFETILIYK